MIALLRKKKRPAEAPPEEVVVTQAAVSPDYNRVFLLIPEGAYIYRLVVFLDVKSAGSYIDTYLLPAQSAMAFWASDPDDPKGRTQSGEALVLVAEDGRPDVLRPYSFTDVAAARSFLGEGASGQDAGRPLLVWAEPVSIARGLTVPPAGATPDVSRRQPAAVYAQPALATAGAIGPNHDIGISGCCGDAYRHF